MNHRSVAFGFIFDSYAHNGGEISQLYFSASCGAALGATLPIAGAAIAGLETIALGAGAALYSVGSALFAMSKSASDYGSEIFDASQKTGLAVEIQTKIIEQQTDAQKKINEASEAFVRELEAHVERQFEIEQQILEIRKEARDVERQIVDFRKEQERKVLVNTVDSSYGKERLAALERLANFDLLEEERRQQIRIDDLEAEKSAAIERLTVEEIELGKREELNRLYRERELLSEAEFHARKREIEEESEALKRTAAAENTTGGFFAGALSGLIDEVDPLNKITDQAEYMKAVYADLRATAQEAIGSMIQGLGNLVSQWIITGKFSAKAALQMAGSVITGVAIQAGIKALFEIAEGYAMLANPFTAYLAPGHFAAAAAYGVVAAAAGAVGVGLSVASRAFGGNKAAAAQSQGGYGAASTDTQKREGSPEGVYSSRDEQIVNLTRNMPIGENRPVMVGLNVKTEAGFGNWLRFMVDNDGITRAAIRKASE